MIWGGTWKRLLWDGKGASQSFPKPLGCLKILHISTTWSYRIFFAPTSLPWLKSFFAMGVTPLQRSLASKNIPDWNLWDIFEHKLNVYAGKSFFYGGKELGVGRLLLVPWIDNTEKPNIYWFCLCYLHPCLLLPGNFGPWLPVIVSAFPNNPHWSLQVLLKPVMKIWQGGNQRKEQIIFRVAPYYFDVRKSNGKAFFPLFWKKK